MTAPIIDFSFPHTWTAEILAARPLILPPRHYVYPRDAEEVERGALEVLIRPLANKESDPGALKGHDSSSAENTALKAPDFSRAENAALKGHNFSCAENTALKGHDFSRAENTPIETGALAPEGRSSQAFLATCVLGFRDPKAPTGIWSAPNPHEICAVSGGYAYLIDTAAPERFTMVSYRPVLEVHAITAFGLLLLVGHHSILAWGIEGQAWESAKLSDEGVTITSVETGLLRGLGWEMMSDKETPFALDLKTGHPV